MDSAFQDACNSFLNRALAPIAKLVKTKAGDFEKQSEEELVVMFRKQCGISAPPPPPAAHSMSMQSNLPPALNGPGAPPSNLSGLGTAPPSAAKGKSRSTGGAGKKSKEMQQHYSLEDYKADHAEGKPVCAYMSNRGQHKDTVCGGPADNTQAESNPLKWRCSVCLTPNFKIGIIEKNFGPGKGVRGKPTTGYNAPTGVPSASKPFPPAPPGSRSGPIPPPPLPNANGHDVKTKAPPLPNTNGAAEATSDKMKVFRNKSLDGVFFPRDEKFSGLAIMETDNKELYCIGRVSGFVPTKDCEVPVDWADKLVELSAEDLAYSKKNDVMYGFKNENIAKIA
jgi:hypothetical protein